MKKSKIISLVLLPVLILALILPSSVVAQDDGQEVIKEHPISTPTPASEEELILKVLKASGEGLGLSGVVAPGYKWGEAQSYLWSGMRNERNVTMTIVPFATEQDAATTLQDSLSQPSYHSAEFHGYPAVVTDFGAYMWRCGRFFFSVDDHPKLMQDTANVLYANAVKHGLISGEGKAAPEIGEDQGESVYSEDVLEKLEEFIEKFKEAWNSFITWIKSILEAK